MDAGLGMKQPFIQPISVCIGGSILISQTSTCNYQCADPTVVSGLAYRSCWRTLSVHIELKLQSRYNDGEHFVLTKVSLMVKKSHIWKTTESMFAFLLVFSSPLCFHYVSISTNSTEVEAVNISCTVPCEEWTLIVDCIGCIGPLSSKLNVLKQKEQEPWLLLKYYLLNIECLGSNTWENFWTVISFYLWFCQVIV